MINGYFYSQINSTGKFYFPDILIFFVLHIYSAALYFAGQFSSRKLPNDPNSVLFAQNFMSCFPYILNPIILLRLLSHRLLTTAPLHRWKSSASRSSFGSVITHDVPRSPRSRASSTETETSTLRKRRKVLYENIPFLFIFPFRHFYG